MTDVSLDQLLQAIGADDDEAAEAAIIELADHECDALALLLDLHTSDNADYRWWAVRGLAAVAEQSPDCREATMPALLLSLGDPDDAIRCVAPLALGQMRAICAIPAMTVLLSDQSGWVRGAAADALAMIGEPAVPALGTALHDERDGVRVRAAYALYRIHSERSAPWLFPALNDPNHLVQSYAYEALDEMGLLDTILVQ
ncbi:MAG: HEAT repeat domain-containing protein [Chloroflexota bacterium]|nr:HEAT repeat domain-containing protein [Chloroflexota bacterium]